MALRRGEVLTGNCEEAIALKLRIAIGAFFPSKHCRLVAEGAFWGADRLREEQQNLQLELWQFNTYDRFLRHRNLVKFDGIILYGNYFEVVYGLPHKSWPAITSFGIPCINASNRYDFPEMPKVIQDDLAIGRLAGRFFKNKGYSRFAYFGFPEDFLFSEERRLGFAQGAGIAPGELMAGPTDEFIGERESVLRKQRLLSEWLSTLPINTALFAANDERASLLMPLLEQAGLRVPQDIALMGVEDEPLYTKRFDISLSSIYPGSLSIGALALRTLVSWVVSGVSPPSVQTVDVATVVERVSTDQTAVEDPAIHRLLRALRQLPGRYYDLAAMAEIARLNERTLTRRFRRATGSSPVEYLLQLRIDHARILLTETDHSVSDVAYSSGFNDLKWFFRAFRKHTGTTPATFRKSFYSSR